MALLSYGFQSRVDRSSVVITNRLRFVRLIISNPVPQGHRQMCLGIYLLDLIYVDFRINMIDLGKCSCLILYCLEFRVVLDFIKFRTHVLTILPITV